MRQTPRADSGLPDGAAGNSGSGSAITNGCLTGIPEFSAAGGPLWKFVKLQPKIQSNAPTNQKTSRPNHPKKVGVISTQTWYSDKRDLPPKSVQVIQ
jgi:hypothetical protein